MGARSHQGAHRRCRWQGVPHGGPADLEADEKEAPDNETAFRTKGRICAMARDSRAKRHQRPPPSLGVRGGVRARQCGVMDERVRFINQVVAPLRVAPGRAVELSRDFDSAYADGVKRSEADDLLTQGVELL